MPPPKRPLEMLEDVIAELSARQARISASLDRHLAADHPALKDVITLLALHSQNASKLEQLLRYQHSRDKTAADERAGALNQALDELASELGWNV